MSTGEAKESLWTRFKGELFFRLLWLIATGLAASVRYKIIGWEKMEKLIADGKGGLVLPWHGVTILPIYYCRHMGFYSIVSISKDGELQNKLLRSRGFETIRGSSARHGIRALLEGVRRLKEGKMIAITPDGPKGPPKKVQPGTVHLAQRSGCPVLPVGVACRPCKRLSSWDSHMVPAPFARAVIAFGDPLYVSEADNENEAATRIEQAINEAERQAEELLGVRGSK
ncbi:MAG: lysophospholipid acyltransferase family protein [Armatimonadetes bacterium]|nr:lysophospholipid acyltransferase family protein [Armatimonadota bacterium]